MDLWTACGAGRAPMAIAGRLCRVVESQEQVATMNLVDDLAEQSAIEQLLDRVKPPYRTGTERLHYLLSTPFRYPPLRHGSRFGQRHEPSIFYGSLGWQTALAEAAYYRLVFWHGQVVPPAFPYKTQHLLFEADYATLDGLRLQGLECESYRVVIANPSDYTATQAMGTAMRDAGIRAFEYPSARSPVGGVNVGLFEPDALAADRPTSMQYWLCKTSTDQVVFNARDPDRLIGFALDEFTVNGVLPQPAI
ncbi:MAG: RES family NAD+ phosphorylase [Halothiobacillus sp.]|nr:RES family NAD+ phosphorylase [Halothiobacillus sp.]